MAGGSQADNPVVQELTAKCKELERRGWLGTKIQKWFGGGHNKPFEGVISELWVDPGEDQSPPGIMAHVDFEDGDEEDMDLDEVVKYVVDKDRKKQMGHDVEAVTKPKKTKAKRPLEDSASEDASSTKTGKTASSSTGARGGEAKRQKSSKEKDGKANDKKPKAKEKKVGRTGPSGQQRDESIEKRGDGRAEESEGEDMGGGDDDEADLDKYVQAIRQLFKDDRLRAGQATIFATCGDKTVSADLLEDYRVRKAGGEGKPEVYYVSPEEFAATSFPGADAKDISIAINAMPLQRLEDEMLPPLGLPPGLNHPIAVDHATARKWVSNMEEALALLESVYEDAAAQARQRMRQEQQASSTGGLGASGREALNDVALLDPSMRAHNMTHLKAVVEKVQDFVQPQVPPEDGEAATMAEVDAKVRRAFGVELARLNWVTQSHAKVEKKLAALLEGDQSDEEQRELQEEVGASLGVSPDRLVDRTTPISMHVAQLADYRYQLRCMLLKAKQLLTDRHADEMRYSRQAIASFRRQQDIYKGVKSQHHEVAKKRDKEAKKVASRVATIEQEVQLLSEALELKRAELEKEKAELTAKQEVNNRTLALLDDKKGRWEQKLGQTKGAQRASCDRMSVLRDVHRYLNGMGVEPCIQYQMQHFLNSLCAECCRAWADKAHHTDFRARCRTRLAYEVFGLIKRLWGGSINVVVDLNKISAAFAAVFSNMEAEVALWQGMPMPLASPLGLDGTASHTLQVLGRPVTGVDGDAPPSFYTEPLVPTGGSSASESSQEAPSQVTEAAVREELGYKTLVMAIRPSPSTTAALQRAHDLASQETDEASVSEVNGEAMLMGPLSLDADPIKASPLSHSVPVSQGRGPSWWEEVTDGRTRSFLPANAFGDAMTSVTLLCKAVDALMIANPSPVAAPSDSAQEREGGGQQEQEPLVDPTHLSTNVLVCLKTLGQQAGRYGAPLKHMSSHEQHVVNYVPVAIMYARIVWGIRRVAVVDIGRSLALGTLNCLSGDHDALFACLHTDVRSPDNVERPNALMQSLASKTRSVKHLVRELLSEKLLGVLNDFLPELLLVTSSMHPESDRLNVDPEDLALVVSEMAKVAQRHCMGRLLVVLDGADAKADKGRATAEAAGGSGGSLSAGPQGCQAGGCAYGAGKLISVRRCIAS